MSPCSESPRPDAVAHVYLMRSFLSTSESANDDVDGMQPKKMDENKSYANAYKDCSKTCKHDSSIFSLCAFGSGTSASRVTVTEKDILQWLWLSNCVVLPLADLKQRT